MNQPVHATVFVASTIPLADPWIADLLLNDARVVCNGDDVAGAVSAFLAFRGAGIQCRVANLPASRSQQLRMLWTSVRTSQNVVLTHVCCWPVLDLVVAISRPRGTRVVLANLSSMRPMRLSDIVKSGKLSAAATSRRFGAMSRVAARIAGSPAFRIYRAPGPEGDWVAWVARAWLTARLREVPMSLIYMRDSRGDREENSDTKPVKRTVVMPVGLGSQGEAALRQIYLDVVRLVIDAGYTVVIKDHIRPDARICLERDDDVSSNPRVTIADPRIPAEALIHATGPKAIIGVDSAVLGLAKGRCVSLLPLIDMPEESRSSLRNYLEGLPKGNLIEFVDSLSQLTELLATA